MSPGAGAEPYKLGTATEGLNQCCGAGARAGGIDKTNVKLEAARMNKNSILLFSTTTDPRVPVLLMLLLL